LGSLSVFTSGIRASPNSTARSVVSKNMMNESMIASFLAEGNISATSATNANIEESGKDDASAVNALRIMRGDASQMASASVTIGVNKPPTLTIPSSNKSNNMGDISDITDTGAESASNYNQVQRIAFPRSNNKSTDNSNSNNNSNNSTRSTISTLHNSAAISKSLNAIASASQQDRNLPQISLEGQLRSAAVASNGVPIDFVVNIGNDRVNIRVTTAPVIDDASVSSAGSNNSGISASITSVNGQPIRPNSISLFDTCINIYNNLSSQINDKLATVAAHIAVYVQNILTSDEIMERNAFLEEGARNAEQGGRIVDLLTAANVDADIMIRLPSAPPLPSIADIQQQGLHLAETRRRQQEIIDRERIDREREERTYNSARAIGQKDTLNNNNNGYNPDADTDNDYGGSKRKSKRRLIGKKRQTKKKRVIRRRTRKQIRRRRTRKQIRRRTRSSRR
jgi:hypothetical protein